MKMKNLVFALTMMFSISCTTYDVSIDDIKYTVDKIENMGEQKQCAYFITSNANYAFYDNYLYIVDSIGKFAIGDTIILKSEKYGE